jgi:hypothetical protein
MCARVWTLPNFDLISYCCSDDTTKLIEGFQRRRLRGILTAVPRRQDTLSGQKATDKVALGVSFVSSCSRICPRSRLLAQSIHCIHALVGRRALYRLCGNPLTIHLYNFASAATNIYLGGGGDPPVKLPDPRFNAGATVTLRSPPIAGKTTLFVRSGMLVPIDANKSATAFEAGQTGQAYKHEHYTVPVVGGVAVPATALGIPMENLSFEAFAGVQIRNRTMGYTWTGAGIPGGSVSASDNFTTVDPAIGGGIQYYLGTFYGIPTSLGTNLTFYRVEKSHTVDGALSSSLTEPAHYGAAGMVGLNFDIPTK